MPNMNSSKRARQQDSIKNLPTCGGNKKSGLRRFIGMDTSLSLGRFGSTPEQQPGLPCTGTLYTTIRNQVCAGGVGKQVNMRHCGIGASFDAAAGGGDGLPVTVGATGIIFLIGEEVNYNPTFWRSPGTIMRSPNGVNEIGILINSINIKEQSLGNTFSEGTSIYFYPELKGKPIKLDDDGSDFAKEGNINDNGVIIGYSKKNNIVRFLLWERYDKKPQVFLPDDGVTYTFPSGGDINTRRLNNKEEFLIYAIKKNDDNIDIKFTFFANQRAKVELKQEYEGITYAVSFAYAIGENNNAVGTIGDKIVDGNVTVGSPKQPVLWTNIDLVSGNNEVKILSKNVNGKEMYEGEIRSINKNNQMVGIVIEREGASGQFVVYKTPNSNPVPLQKPKVLLGSDKVVGALTAKIGDHGDLICTYLVGTITFVNESNPSDDSVTDPILNNIEVRSFYYKDMNAEPEEYISPNSSDNFVVVSDFISKPK